MSKSQIEPGVISVLQNLHKRVTAIEPITSKPDYFGKEGKDSKDQKSVVLRTALSQMTKGNAAMNPRTLRASFSGHSLTIGSIGTAYGTVLTLTPGTAVEFSSLAALFDDWRTTHIDVCCKVMPTTTNSTSGSLTGTGVAPGNAILVYDPVDNTSISSAQMGLNYQQSTGVWSVIAPGNGYPAAYTRNGFQEFHVKIPAPVVDPGILSDLLDSNWVSTKDTGVIVGYLKPYVDVMGAATYCVFEVFLRYHCEFRSRQ